MRRREESKWETETDLTVPLSCQAEERRRRARECVLLCPGAASGLWFRARGQPSAACGDGAVEPVAGSEAVEGGARYNLPVVRERERERGRGFYLPKKFHWGNLKREWSEGGVGVGIQKRNHTRNGKLLYGSLLIQNIQNFILKYCVSFFFFCMVIYCCFHWRTHLFICFVFPRSTAWISLM